jgi:hypothetical protein
MSVCEQNAGKILKACTRLQDLALGALPAIDQKTILIVFNDLG